MSIREIGVVIAKIVFMLILLLTVITGGLVWMDYLGFIDFRSRLAPVASFLGFKALEQEEQPFSPVLLDDERLEKERQALTIRQQEFEKMMEEFALREAELKQRESEIAEREKSVEERQNSLNEAISQYDNRIVNLEQTAQYMMGMPPSDAVAIMDQYELNNLVDLLRTSERLSQAAGEASLVSFWLSIMSDRNRAAEIQRLLVEKPGMSLNSQRFQEN